MRPTLTFAALVLLLLAAGARAGRPALVHGPTEVPGRTLLLVLEAGPDGVAVRDARIAPVRAKTRGNTQLAETAGEDDALLLALRDEAGEPVTVVEIVVPWMLHGPFLGEDGEMHCRGERQERVVFGAKIPLPAEAAELLVLRRGAAAPTHAADILRALRATPADFGLIVRCGGRLDQLPGLGGLGETAP